MKTDEMKIAFMLTLYGNPEQANIFIRQLLQYDNSYIFIQIDRKGLEIKDKLIKDERIRIMPESILVNWGDYSQTEAVVQIMKYAYQFGPFDYYSLHSGSDLLVRPMDELIEYLINNPRYAFTTSRKLPWKKWQYGGGMARIALKWPEFFRRHYSVHSPMRYLRSLYGKAYGAHLIPGRKLPPDIVFYGICNWFTISQQCMEDALNYIETHPEYSELYKDSLISCEIYFTTLFHLFGSTEIEDDNDLRYIDFANWDKNVPGSPKLLRNEDFEKIVRSRKFFARKVDIRADKELVDRLVRKANKE